MPKWAIGIIATIVVLSIGLAVQFSGVQNIKLAIVLLVIAGIGGMFLLLNLPPVARRIRSPRLKRLVTRDDLNSIVPKLQITPFAILDDDKATTAMKMYVLNCSNYVAKNISVDIKFGKSQWKKELHRAASLNAHKRFFSPNQEEMTRHRSFLELPILDKLEPGQKRVIGMIDENKDWLSNQKMLFASGNESKTLSEIPVKDNPLYQESQGWKEQVEDTKGDGLIQISFCMAWENETGKAFGQVVEYQLICTKIGATRSYKFLPTGT